MKCQVLTSLGDFDSKFFSCFAQYRVTYVLTYNSGFLLFGVCSQHGSNYSYLKILCSALAHGPKAAFSAEHLYWKEIFTISLTISPRQ